MYRGGGGGWNTFWEPLSRHWERLRSSDVTPHMDVDLLDHVSFWNCPLPAISDYRFSSCMCKHLSLKNPEVQFKTKRESNECLSFWKNKLLNLRIRIRARLFWKKMPSSISGTPLNAQERSWPLSLLSAWCLISWQDRSSAALQKLWAVITELGVNYSVSVTFFWWRLTKWVALCDSGYLTSRWITAD